jgi:hypothetical protein
MAGSHCRTCRVRVGALHELEQAAGVDDEVLRPTAEVAHEHGHEEERLQHIVPAQRMLACPSGFSPCLLPTGMTLEPRKGWL